MDGVAREDEEVPARDGVIAPDGAGGSTVHGADVHSDVDDDAHSDLSGSSVVDGGSSDDNVPERPLSSEGCGVVEKPPPSVPDPPPLPASPPAARPAQAKSGGAPGLFPRALAAVTGAQPNQKPNNGTSARPVEPCRIFQ